ncbi:TetR/AcrR family transcriptional regulator [Sphingomonas sp. GC_Shp_1]|uniref:TetR/AcrR family transcriptional regulator n=1 Tax=unclassified Sphingomonas TaxID=196159 RepID=UPI00226A0867
MKQGVDPERKKPRQDRSRQTVDTILEATAQILDDDGGKGLTTNLLAQHAGYSIGTLYQYFDNREAIVVALIERQRETMRREIDALLEARAGEPWEKTVQAIVRLMHDAFARHRHVDPRLIRSLVAFALERGLPEPTEHVADAIIAVWRGAGEAHIRRLSDAGRFVLTTAIVEVLRATTLRSLSLLGTIELEEAIVRLVMGFLNEA